jgi:hypothetical protein
MKPVEESMADQVIYASQCTAKSLWHAYRVYADRVELDTMFGTMAVPFDQVQGVGIAHDYWQGVRLQLRGFRPGLKLDWADFHEHVVLDKATGLFRHVAFTPDNPEAFVAALETALARFREQQGGGAP